MIRNLTKRLRQFCKDQGGMEALQTVCICAIAATVMIAAANLGTEGSNWMKKNWDEMKETSDEGLKAALQSAASAAASDAVGDAFDAGSDALSGATL